jgi:dihydroxyacetone kinase-like predicted kinase
VVAAVVDRVRDVAAVLERDRDAIDALNVFPVADHDTGTNMATTLREALEVVEAEPPGTLHELLAALPRAALRAARGNSGLLLAAWIAGACESLRRDLPEGVEPDGTDLAAHVAGALTAGAASSRNAVGEPREGTFITVADVAARGAGDAIADVLAAASADDGSDVEPADPRAAVEAVLSAAATRAAEAVSATTAQLDVLEQAGVVDAGGLGLLVALRAASGDDIGVAGLGATTAAVPTDAPSAAGHRDGPPSPGELVEVMLDVEGGAADSLREAWAALGDSIAVAGGPRVWHAHLHTTRPDDAVAAAARIGQVSNVRTSSVFADPGHDDPPSDAAPHGNGARPA